MGASLPANLQMTLTSKFQSSKYWWGQEVIVHPTEPHETMPHAGPHTGMKPPNLSPSFVLIDLREDPEGWSYIENELMEDVRFPAH